MDVGRPPFFKTVEAMEEKIQEYLNTSKAPNVAGLALALGFVSRQSLFDYSAKSDGFSDTIKKAKLYIESVKVENMLTGDYNTAGAIFDLTNNHGYQNTRNVDHTSKGEALTALPPSPKPNKKGKFKKRAARND